MIKLEDAKLRYFDKNREEILEGCTIKYADGKTKKVYMTENGELGTDATNPRWIELGKAVACEYGIYPLEHEETDEVEVIK